MLEVQHLTKKFKNGKGIFDVTFSIKQGEVFGFLRPNGAGKSTAIRHIMGFMKADGGFIKIDGLDTWIDGLFIVYSNDKRKGCIYTSKCFYNVACLI
jgi:ABC-type multidrug transport system ATPase subunit